MGKPILGYWNLRFMAEPIRFLLHYKKVDFEDRRYDKANQGDWLNVKFNLGLDFPSLPYYIDGDVKLTQSNTILRYLANKYGLDGHNDHQKTRVCIAEQQIVDFRWDLILLIVREDFNEVLRDEFIKTMPDKLKQWENFIGDYKFMAGDDITYVDFMAYEAIDYYRLFHAEALGDCPKLKGYQARIKSLPELQGYLNSSTYKKWPFVGYTAKWGGGGDPPKHL